MAMEINDSYNRYGTDYEEQLKARRQEKAEEAKAAEKNSSVEKGRNDVSALKDEYISSEASGNKPSGLYRLGQDENGNPKVFYDDPKKRAGKEAAEKESAEKEQAGKKAVDADQDENPKASEEKCVGSTDRVDREIKRLKEQKKQLEQQIRAAAGDEEKVKELQAELTQLESELSQKDNDTYRRQNTVFTSV